MEMLVGFLMSSFSWVSPPEKSKLRMRGTIRVDEFAELLFAASQTLFGVHERIMLFHYEE